MQPGISWQVRKDEETLCKLAFDIARLYNIATIYHSIELVYHRITLLTNLGRACRLILNNMLSGSAKVDAKKQKIREIIEDQIM